VPSGWDQRLAEFEATSLHQAVELAGELRVMAHGRVQIRPAPRRLLRRRWSVTMTTPATTRVIEPGWTTELRDLASRHPGCRLVDTDTRVVGRVNTGLVRVLIVDDSAPFRRAVRELLTRRGYLVVGEAGSAAAARVVVERVAPHALLLDVGLPDGCGFDLAAALTRARPDLAVLLMSANDPPAREERLEASGARGFVLKSDLAAIPLERFWRGPSP
jgi:CheY-like chemotaxis protein